MADKLLLLVLWGYAPYTLIGHATGKQVYPSRRMLAEETGQTVDAVRDQLRRLLAAGWIRVDGEGWALAWLTPFGSEAGDSNPGPPATQTQIEATQTQAHRRLESPGPGDSNPDRGDSNPDRGDSSRRPSEQGSFNLPGEQSAAPDPERAVIAMLIELNVAGSNPGPSFVAPMLERMRLDGCTLADVRKIAVEWKRRKDAGDKGLCQLRSLFYAGGWWKTKTEYLGERPSQLAARARASTPSISESWADYDATNG